MSFPISLPSASPLVVLTHPSEWLWIIELKNGVDNRVTKQMVEDGLQPALDIVETGWREQWRVSQQNKEKDGPKGALIFVGARNQEKFFSNGLDFANVITDLNFFPVTFNPLLARLLTFPIPTVAAINGHCMAGAMMLTLACDYRVMTDGSKRRAVMSMNEVLFGAIWPLSFATLLKVKVPHGQTVRKVALEGHMFTPKEALQFGLVDHLVEGNTEAVLARAVEVGEVASANARHGVWGLIKSDLYRDVLETFQKHSRPISPHLDYSAAASRLKLSKL